MLENTERQSFTFFAFLPPYIGVSGSLVSRKRQISMRSIDWYQKFLISCLAAWYSTVFVLRCSKWLNKSNENLLKIYGGGAFSMEPVMGDGGVLSLGLEMGGGRFWIRTKVRDLGAGCPSLFFRGSKSFKKWVACGPFRAPGYPITGPGNTRGDRFQNHDF